jgi:hypothetical protein
MGLQVKLNEARIKCSICHNYYASKASLAKHRLRKHITADEKPYKCSGCDKGFMTDKGRRQHVRSYCISKNFREEESIVEEYYECENEERNREAVSCMYCYEGDFRGIKEVLDHMRECRLANNGA